MGEHAKPEYHIALIAFCTRREGMTRSEFYDYNETVFIPLVKSLFGKLQPVYWARSYNVEASECLKGVPPVLLGTGKEDILAWDAMGEMIFRDELHLQQFVTFMHSEEGTPVFEAEAKCIDQEKTKLVVVKRVGDWKGT